MTPFSSDQWVMLLLVFLLGLFVGMMFLSGGKWKRRHREEIRRREEIEAENARLRKDAHEMDTLRSAAARHPVDRDRGPL